MYTHFNFKMIVVITQLMSLNKVNVRDVQYGTVVPYRAVHVDVPAYRTYPAVPAHRLILVIVIINLVNIF
eukprot:SAG31_NODE_1112_length_9855_cov_13.754203_13_plen_70_part_00